MKQVKMFERPAINLRYDVVEKVNAKWQDVTSIVIEDKTTIMLTNGRYIFVDPDGNIKKTWYD